MKTIAVHNYNAGGAVTQDVVVVPFKSILVGVQISGGVSNPAASLTVATINVRLSSATTLANPQSDIIASIYGLVQRDAGIGSSTFGEFLLVNFPMKAGQNLYVNMGVSAGGNVSGSVVLLFKD